MHNYIHSKLDKYYQESLSGITNKSPSRLNRGEGLIKDYYIFKIDLAGSTDFIATKQPQTYLKLTHTFLSTADEITKEYGADPFQTEYVGDGIIAYFDASNTTAFDVLESAFLTRQSALDMRHLIDKSFSLYKFRTRIIIHYGNLIMAKIGPRGNSFTSAIGAELHNACKMETLARPGQGIISDNYRKQLTFKEKRFVRKTIPSSQPNKPTYLIDWHLLEDHLNNR